MILCDTGPLVAIIDRDDPYHERCVVALASLPPIPLMTTLPCITEAMHMLRRAGGLRAQEELWGFIVDGLVTVHQTNADEWKRMRDLMVRYENVPMDFADASLVSAAEQLGIRDIFSIDRDFHVFRISGSEAFSVIP